MKHFYTNENLIFLPFFFLTLLVLVLAVLWIAKFMRLYEKETEVPDTSDLPGRYSDVEFSEQPFIEYYN
jgi:hypothetical protein